MLPVSAVIVLAWVLLLGSAMASRLVLRLRRRACALVVAGCYALLCIPTLAWFGLTGTGLAAVTGLGLPCAVSVAFVVLWPGR